MHANEWLDLKRAEQDYPVSRRTYWKWISEGRLPVYRPFGRKVLLKRSDIEEVLEASRADADLDMIVKETLAGLSAAA